MSWSISATGMPSVVMSTVTDQVATVLDNPGMPQPEKDSVSKVVDLINQVCGVSDQTKGISVSAYGSGAYAVYTDPGDPGPSEPEQGSFYEEVTVRITPA